MRYADLDILYHQPFFSLLQQARGVHEDHWSDSSVQLCALLSIKTGGCSEDCSYCAQSAHYTSGLDTERLMEKGQVLEQARVAKENGSTRFCMGAAGKGVRVGTREFESVLEIIRDVSALEIEVCVTLGELGAEEAEALRQAGVTAYNHNIDTSPENYPNIVTTHGFQDRLNTIRHVQEAGMSVCCGGILGLGETVEDRLRMLEVISEFNPSPESIPINTLMPMPGTPLADGKPVDVFDLARLIALTRISVPRARVRLSAGRTCLSDEAQALCFFAGANSIFYGDKLLTAANPAIQNDLALLKKLDLEAKPADRSAPAPCSNPERPLSPAPK
ncbi:MAG: biotin synthase BioB [Roseibacillus sp.]|jgi:biotin synthase|nr:biotin synthase BioB [Roseibacillus sp.]MBP34929.1 biotin synthase BioB [Roseibacillus sp.]MCP4732256.1 biotin synthase BioB [Roseibacillus sp.]HJM65445.1 biotin synthase BioB [Roseibacillus sp.]|tara:strand:+ start:3343 stop:4338 length:996 start_codon:yes stop_codon:yes gene_type:complete